MPKKANVQKRKPAAARLADAKERVLQLWEQRAQANFPGARRIDVLALRNSLPRQIDELVRVLSKTKLENQQDEINALGREHDRERGQQPYELSQVVEEYHLLRKVLFEVLREGGELTVNEQEAILTSIENGIRGSTAAFMAYRNEQAREDESRYRLVVEGIRDHAIIRFDPNGIIVDWTPGAESVIGYSKDEVVGKPGSIIFTPNDIAHADDQTEMKIAREKGRAEDNRWHVKKDGSRFFAIGVINPLWSEHGNLLGYIKVLRDITDQKASEQRMGELVRLLDVQKKQLEVEKQKLDAIVKNSPTAMALIRGRDLVFEFVNPRYRELLGHRDFAGKTFEEALPELAESEFPGLIRGVFETGQSYTATGMKARVRTGARGELEERYFDFTYSRIDNEHGKPYGVFNQFLDVTETVRARKAIEESEARVRQIANSLPQIIWTARPDGFVDWYNDWWYKYLDLPHGTRWDDEDTLPMHPDDVAKTKVLWYETVAAGKNFEMEQRFRRGSDGQYRWHLVRGVPICDSNGRITKYIGSNTDIHDQKLLTEELQRARAAAEMANQAKSSFLANMSHEIRTPMTSVLGFTEVLRDPRLDEAERLDAISRIERSGRALLRVIDDVLDISKVEAGKLEIQNSKISPVDVASDVISILRIAAEQKGLYLRLIVDSSAPTYAHSDPIRLRQILMNLVGNAVKFTSSGGVTLTLRSLPPTLLVFEVSDTGIGISSADQDKLFQPFAQADQSITRSYGGTGLGLHLSRLLAEQMGGSLIIQESTQGKGSTFRLSVEGGPFDFSTSRDSQERSEQVTRPRDETARSLTGVRILLAEDVPDNQALMRRYLSGTGAEVHLASNGEEAVACAEAEDYDLILMDIQMPKLDGIQATKQLRARGYQRPILALTAHAMSEEVARSLAAGCNTHVTKPVTKSRLLDAIRTHLH